MNPPPCGNWIWLKAVRVAALHTFIGYSPKLLSPPLEGIIGFVILIQKVAEK